MIRALPFFFFATICFADPTSDLKTHVWESGDKDKDGKPDIRVETTTRAKTRILGVTTRTSNGITTTSRAFSIEGEIVMIEGDEDGNGSYETIVIYNPPKKDIEAFIRKPDGSVSPVDANTLAALTEQHAAISAFWDEALGDTADTTTFPSAAKELQRKLKEAEDKKTEATK